MKKRTDSDVLAQAKMIDEGGAMSESFKNDPRINQAENQARVHENNIKHDKN